MFFEKTQWRLRREHNFEWQQGHFRKSFTYTYNEILDILATPEWTDPNPMGGI